MPQLSEEANAELGKALTLEELEKALQSMECGQAPGLDGLSVDFYKSFGWRWVRTYWRCLRKAWPAGGYPQVAVEQFSPCCRKKETLNDIKNWRPVSLLCNDYKLFSKALANRLGEVLEQVIHPDQTYCVPGRQIVDNISFVRDVLDLVKGLNLDFGLLSLDKEKAFDRVEHKYLWYVLEAFGFSSIFFSMVKALYSDVESILKVNGDLCAPFKVFRGIRQGCALSGMLYALAIEPFLSKLRTDLYGLHIPKCLKVFTLSAYADDVVIFISCQNDVNLLLKLLKDF